MNKLSALTLLAYVFALLTAERVAAAPVTWDFYATSCTTEIFSTGIGGCDPKQQYPVLLSSLTLAGPDSSGSAVWDGFPNMPPVYSGDSFVLAFLGPPLSPSFAGSMQCAGGDEICDFDLSWSETGGQLDTVSINVDEYHNSLGATFLGAPLGLAGGIIATDNNFAPCINGGTCRVTGYWTDVPLVAAPEPGSLALMASAFGVWGLTRRRRAGGRPVRLWLPVDLSLTCLWRWRNASPRGACSRSASTG